MKFHKKILLKKSVFLFIALIIALFVFIFFLTIKDKVQISENIAVTENTLKPSTQKEINLAYPPTRITIPSLKIDAPIENLGLTADGYVDSPTGPENTAWFNQSPIPGAIGSAVINGHSGWKNNAPAVFDNLHKLKKGDEIFIENELGVIDIFIVERLKTYNKEAEAWEVFNSTDNKANLNLITCIGDWNKKETTRENRIVVFTTLKI